MPGLDFPPLSPGPRLSHRAAHQPEQQRQQRHRPFFHQQQQSLPTVYGHVSPVANMSYNHLPQPRSPLGHPSTHTPAADRQARNVPETLHAHLTVPTNPRVVNLNDTAEGRALLQQCPKLSPHVELPPNFHPFATLPMPRVQQPTAMATATATATSPHMNHGSPLHAEGRTIDTSASNGLRSHALQHQASPSRSQLQLAPSYPVSNQRNGKSAAQTAQRHPSISTGSFTTPNNQPHTPVNNGTYLQMQARQQTSPQRLQYTQNIDPQLYHQPPATVRTHQAQRRPSMSAGRPAGTAKGSTVVNQSTLSSTADGLSSQLTWAVSSPGKRSSTKSQGQKRAIEGVIEVPKQQQKRQTIATAHSMTARHQKTPQSANKAQHPYTQAVAQRAQNGAPAAQARSDCDLFARQRQEEEKRLAEKQQQLDLQRQRQRYLQKLENERREQERLYQAQMVEKERREKRKSEIKADPNANFHSLLEAYEYWPLPKGERQNRYLLGLLANQRMPMEVDSELGHAIIWAKKNWQLYREYPRDVKECAMEYVRERAGREEATTGAMRSRLDLSRKSDHGSTTGTAPRNGRR
ncbi:hypothetical protein ACN47E_009704 [Coniothyrium glycines]